MPFDPLPATAGLQDIKLAMVSQVYQVILGNSIPLTNTPKRRGDVRSGGRSGNAQNRSKCFPGCPESVRSARSQPTPFRAQTA